MSLEHRLLTLILCHLLVIDLFFMLAPHPEIMNLITDFKFVAPAGPPPRNHESEASFIQRDPVSVSYYRFQFCGPCWPPTHRTRDLEQKSD